MSIKSRATKRTGYHPGFGPWGGRANYGGVGNPLATRTGRHRTPPTFMFGGQNGDPMKRLKTTKGLTQWHLENGVVKTKVKCYDKNNHYALHYQHPDAETAGGVDTMANKVPFNRANVNNWATDEQTNECDGTPTVAELLKAKNDASGNVDDRINEIASLENDISGALAQVNVAKDALDAVNTTDVNFTTIKANYENALDILQTRISNKNDKEILLTKAQQELNAATTAYDAAN